MHKAAGFLISEIFKKKRYCRQEFEIGERDIIIDTGANMGLFTMWVAPQVAKGKIIAVEPIEESINILNTNLERNGIENAKTIRAALGIDGQYMEFITYPGFNVINHRRTWQPTLYTKTLVNLLTTQWRHKKITEKAPTMSLGRIIDDNCLDKVDLLKMDIEGCEYEVFRNLSDRHFGKIKRIAMEYHEYCSGNKGPELISILRYKKYNVKVQKPLLDYYFGKCGFIWAWRD